MDRMALLWMCLAVSTMTWSTGHAQEEQESSEVYLEEYTDEFQENFFEALKQKGIQNYDRAVDLFLKCKQLDPANSVVDYELAKAYLLDKQYILAQEYAITALNAEPTDFWYLDNLLSILEKQGVPWDAIKEQIPYSNGQLKQNLALGYFKKQKYQDALNVLKELDNSTFATDLTSKIKDSLEHGEKEAGNVVTREAPRTNEDDPMTEYRGQIDNLLTDGNYQEALAISKEALDTYPLQPYFYYAYGAALNNTSNANKAIEVLESGLDYLLDDTDALANLLYKELSKAYTSIGNTSKANEYLNKIKSGL
jgi:tetratricopeptide (TPR) repeat protein